MKISPRGLKKLVSTCVASVLSFGLSLAAHAQVLYIDDTDPSDTIITASNVPLTIASIPGYRISIGVDLVNFFSSDTASMANFTIEGANTLTTGDGSAGVLTFNQVAPDELTSRGETELALWNNDAGMISFTNGSPAFSGVITVDLSNMPTLRPMGDVIAGSTAGGSGAVIGEWMVGAPPVAAPEPSTWALLVGSVLLLPWLRRFCRA